MITLILYSCNFHHVQNSSFIKFQPRTVLTQKSRIIFNLCVLTWIRSAGVNSRQCHCNMALKRGHPSLCHGHSWGDSARQHCQLSAKGGKSSYLHSSHLLDWSSHCRLSALSSHWRRTRVRKEPCCYPRAFSLAAEEPSSCRTAARCPCRWSIRAISPTQKTSSAWPKVRIHAN